jgi:hypothetical protein
MRRIAVAVGLLVAWAGAADAQGVDNRSRARNNPGTAPFNSDWAKPYPQTGGYIYMDPRTQRGPRGTGGQQPRCPVGTSYVPNQGCR